MNTQMPRNNCYKLESIINSTRLESHLSHNLFQPRLCAISMVFLAPMHLAHKVLLTCRFSEKQPNILPRESLKILPHVASRSEPQATPSMLLLIQPQIGGHQSTYLITGPVLGWTITLKFLRIVNSLIEIFTDNATATTTQLKMLDLAIRPFWNLDWFQLILRNHTKWMIAEIGTSNTCLLWALAQVCKMVCGDVISNLYYPGSTKYMWHLIWHSETHVNPLGQSWDRSTDVRPLVVGLPNWQVISNLLLFEYIATSLSLGR